MAELATATAIADVDVTDTVIAPVRKGAVAGLLKITLLQLKNYVLAGLGSGSTATLDTDGTLAANSDTRVPSQKAVKTYVDASVVGLLQLQGSTDCSTNPNYPAALKGDFYVVTVAGKIGGASGSTVAIGDIYFATADNAGGTQAAVGASWDILVHASVAAGGGLLAANNLSDVASPSTALANLGGAPNLLTVDTVAGTTYTLAAADNLHHKRFTNAAAIALTLPKNATAAIPVGIRTRLSTAGAGQVTIAGEDGTVTVLGKNGLKSAGQYAVFEVEKIATDTWLVLGDTTT
jgi:hypothetical protein